MDKPLHTLFTIQPLRDGVVNQPQGTVLRSSLPYCYTIRAVKAEAESADAGDGSLVLYFISPGQLASAPLGSQAQGLALLFSDEFFCLTGEEKDLLLQCGLFNAEPRVNQLVLQLVQHRL